MKNDIIMNCKRKEFCFLSLDFDKEFKNEDEMEPTTFQEAWHHPNKKEREKWREAIRKEFRAQINKGVFRKKNRSDVPSNKRCIKCKWVFKKKSNGVYRARLVACGYSQIPNVDYTESFNLVVNDVTWKVL